MSLDVKHTKQEIEKRAKEIVDLLHYQWQGNYAPCLKSIQILRLTQELSVLKVQYDVLCAVEQKEINESFGRIDLKLWEDPKWQWLREDK